MCPRISFVNDSSVCKIMTVHLYVLSLLYRNLLWWREAKSDSTETEEFCTAHVIRICNQCRDHNDCSSSPFLFYLVFFLFVEFIECSPRTIQPTIPVAMVTAIIYSIKETTKRKQSTQTKMRSIMSLGALHHQSITASSLA